MKTTKMKIAIIVTIIAAVLSAAAVFMPFASSIDDTRKNLKEYSENESVEGSGITNGDMVDVSLFEYGKAYAFLAKSDIQKEIAIGGIVLIGAYAFFALLTLLFSAIKKPIATIIFEILTMGVFLLLRFDFSDRGVVPSRSYDWGFGNYVVFIMAVLIVVGSVITLVEKKREKNNGKVNQM